MGPTGAATARVNDTTVIILLVNERNMKHTKFKLSKNHPNVTN